MMHIVEAGAVSEAEIIDCLRHIAAGGKKADLAMEQLFLLYAARIKVFFKRHRMSDEEAADLLQETFIKVYRFADQFQGQSKVSTWIWTIARNGMLDYVRSKKPHASLDSLLEDGITPEALITPPEQDDSETVLDCVQRGFIVFATAFPDRAHALRLSAFEGWSVEELAGFLSRSPSATREYLSQCRKKLSPFLEHCREWLSV